MTAPTAGDAKKIIAIAGRHAESESALQRGSAVVALNDAKKLLDDGRYDYAAQRGLKSLAYSVGTFDSAYLRAARILNEAA